MRKQNILRSSVSYIFWEKQKSIQLGIHGNIWTQNMGTVNLLSTGKLWENTNIPKVSVSYTFHYSISREIRNPYNSENMGSNWILIVRETYGKTQTYQSYGFLTYFVRGINTYNSQNMRKVNSHSKEKIWENTNTSRLRVSGIFHLKQKSMQFPTNGKSGFA